MLDAYIERRVSPKMFLTSFFGLSPRGIHSSEHVEIDVRRGEPRIAIPVPSITAGARKVENSKYQNKKLIPAVIKLEGSISAWSTGKRRPGMTAFEDPDFRRAAMDEAFTVLNDCEDMTRRTVELMAAQALQTGRIDLKDSANVTVYPIDFEARPSHYIVTTPWAADGSTGNPLADLDAGCRVVRRDGKSRPTDVIFGSGSRARFLANAKVKDQFNNWGLQKLQDIAPQAIPDDATYIGEIVVGNYRLRAWEYDADYIDPVTNEVTPYVDENSVIIIAKDGRRDQTYGDIPQFVPPEARAAQFLPSRMSSVAQGFDLTTNIWVSPDGSNLNVSAGTRPLPVPTALDTHACLTVYTP
jgi:hypothetical protein